MVENYYFLDDLLDVEELNHALRLAHLWVPSSNRLIKVESVDFHLYLYHNTYSFLSLSLTSYRTMPPPPSSRLLRHLSSLLSSTHPPLAPPFYRLSLRPCFHSPPPFPPSPSTLLNNPLPLLHPNANPARPPKTKKTPPPRLPRYRRPSTTKGRVHECKDDETQKAEQRGKEGCED